MSKSWSILTHKGTQSLATTETLSCNKTRNSFGLQFKCMTLGCVHDVCPPQLPLHHNGPSHDGHYSQCNYMVKTSAHKCFIFGGFDHLVDGCPFPQTALHGDIAEITKKGMCSAGQTSKSHSSKADLPL